jgi:peptide/nickel transport system substrate-binding protein
MTLLFLTSLLGGCSSEEAQKPLMIGGTMEFTSMDPAKDGYIYTRMQLAETLLDVNAKGALRPSLATNWTLSDDRLSWQLELREDVTFHDGTPLDAAAVVKSLSIARSKQGALSKAPVTVITATGSHRVTIELRKPYNPLGAVLAHYSTLILSPAAYAEDGSVTAFIGSGPYQLEEYAPPHKLTVTRNDRYWGSPASFEKAQYLTGHRAESRALQARSGQADIIYTLDPSGRRSLVGVDHLSLHSEPIPRTVLLKLNSGHPFLNDVKARRALSLALDRSGIATSILRVPGAEANQLVPPFLSDWHLDTLAPAVQDQAEARRLLAELGWKPDGAGMLLRDGEPFRLRLITYADRPELSAIATAIQAQLAEIGVAAEVEITNSSAIPSGHQDGSLEMALIARNFGVIADPLGVMQLDLGTAGSDWGAMNWQHPEVHRLLDELSVESGRDEYRRKAQHIAGLLASELPLIPITFYTEQIAVNRRLKGFRFDPFERSYHISELELAH